MNNTITYKIAFMVIFAFKTSSVFKTSSTVSYQF